jgi:hypothetical protein
MKALRLGPYAIGFTVFIFAAPLESIKINCYRIIYTFQNSIFLLAFPDA